MERSDGGLSFCVGSAAWFSRLRKARENGAMRRLSMAMCRSRKVSQNGVYPIDFSLRRWYRPSPSVIKGPFDRLQADNVKYMERVE
jgi:hypothetical protein